MESPPADTGGAPDHKHSEDDTATAEGDRPARPETAASLDQVLRRADEVRKAEVRKSEAPNEVDRPD